MPHSLRPTRFVPLDRGLCSAVCNYKFNNIIAYSKMISIKFYCSGTALSFKNRWNFQSTLFKVVLCEPIISIFLSLADNIESN